MVLLIVVLAVGAYFGQRWRVSAYRAHRQWVAANHHAAVTTCRPRS